MQAAIDEGHIVKLPPEALERPSSVYYIPHFNTQQTKFRVVYDAAREFHGMSLNKLLGKGPIFMKTLSSILLRFGERKYGLISDIKNMFFQIRIHPDDRDMLRILWFDKPDMQGDIVAYQFQVAPYGLKCVPSMAGYALQYTAERNLPKVSDSAVGCLKRDVFVDDVITGVDTIDEGKRLVTEMRDLLASTGFKLQKWSSSAKEILAELEPEDLAPAIREISTEDWSARESVVQHTLGLVWNTTSDQLYLKQPNLDFETTLPLTKRSVLSISHRIFDPLSLWVPLYISTKVCCSKIMRRMTEWDEPLAEDLTKDWKKCLESLKSLGDVPVPRRRIPFVLENDWKYELHVFSDSSKDVAAAAAYLRFYCDTECGMHLVAAKAIVLSRYEAARGSIPRKELIAVEIGSRLMVECLESTSLDIQCCELWTDSQTVIKWCSSPTLELKVFERNRVDLILKRTRGKCPRYIPTVLNPADIATRGCSISDPEKFNYWLQGPKQFVFSGEGSMICFSTPSTAHAIFCEGGLNDQEGIEFMSHALNRTNSLSRILRILRRVVLCFEHWKRKAGIRAVKVHDFTEREERKILIRAAQRECHEELISIMVNGATFEEALKKISKKQSRSIHFLKSLIPFIDGEGILRVGGRLDYAVGLTDEAKHPALLPVGHKITKLFVLDRHAKLAHRSAEWVLASLNNDLGVRPIGGVKAVRSHLTGCHQCKLIRKKKAEQLMASLPGFRVRSGKPVFNSICLDYAGPYEVKRGRSIEKRWICIFVCNSTTAVRVEVVESLTTTSFLNCFQRFLCLTAYKTEHVRSDCSTTFTGANNVLKANSLLEGIAWEFSTPSSSHHQGTVERQIRTFKEVCDCILSAENQKRVPSDFELMTVCRQAEYILNTRPLGKFVGDQDDPKPLRPIDLITGFLDPSDDQSFCHDDTTARDKLLRGHKYTQRLAHEWWERWMNRYFFQLQKRQKWLQSSRNIRKGDFVLLVDPTTPPIGHYPYAVVDDDKLDPDERVRSATVRMADGRVWQRDIRKMVLLELLIAAPPLQKVTVLQWTVKKRLGRNQPTIRSHIRDLLSSTPIELNIRQLRSLLDKTVAKCVLDFDKTH